MRSYRDIFPNRRSFIAVVHAETEEQTMRNIAVARDNGADGAFLINHSIARITLLQFHRTACVQFPEFWMGLNLLGVEAATAANMVGNANGLWVDDAGIRNSGDCSEAHDLLRLIPPDFRNWLYFGGVAFKGQEPITDLAGAARRATPFMDVVTTSGDGTGIAADVDKIRIMKEAVGDHPLAIASGITPENISDYLPYADCFLVATGVSDSHTELNPRRVRMLADAIR